LDVHLIPEYEDLDQQDDNKYMMSDPNNNGEKNKFEEIVEKFCR